MGLPESETRWRHAVAVTVMAKGKAELTSYLSQIRTAIETVTGYMKETERGDAGYQRESRVYAAFINFEIRTVGKE